MKFIASIDQLYQMLAWIREQLREMNFEPAVWHRIELASEEALVNIMDHAYKGLLEKVEIQVTTFPHTHAEILFIDHGLPFNPLDTEPVDLNQSLEERKIGGLGVHLIRQCVDEIRYARVGATNVLTFVIRSSQKR